MLTLCCTAAFLFVCLFLCVWDCFACAYVPGTDLFFLFFFFSFFFHGMVRVVLSWLLFLFFVYGHVVFDFFSVLLNRFLVSFRIRFLLFFCHFVSALMLKLPVLLTLMSMPSSIDVYGFVLFITSEAFTCGTLAEAHVY